MRVLGRADQAAHSSRPFARHLQPAVNFNSRGADVTQAGLAATLVTVPTGSPASVRSSSPAAAPAGNPPNITSFLAIWRAIPSAR